MPDSVVSDSAATAPRERGWRWFVLALALMVVVTAAPLWTPALSLIGGTIRLLLPVEQFALLVLVSLATCAVVGWYVGGRFVVALLWLVIAGWVLYAMPLSASGYGAFVRGWCLSLSASFGLVCLTTRARPFLSRALAATALATAVTMVGVTSRSSVSGTFDDAARMLTTEYQRRVRDALTTWHERTESAAWQTFAKRLPSSAARADRLAATLGALVEVAPSPGGGAAITARGPLLLLAPALLALESLLALGLGWSTYHRLSRVRIGPPLGALRQLRFNDQLVWGLVVGATLVLLPTFTEWRAVGANLICFFGTLYALRGAGVLTWWIPDRVAALVPIALVILVPLLGPVVVLAVSLASTFVLGLGDTWRDFRAGADTRRSGSLR